MKKINTIFSLVLCFCLSAQFMVDSFAQEKTTSHNYKKVEINLLTENTIEQIGKLGIDVQCGVHLSHDHTKRETVTLEVSDYEYKQLVQKGLNPAILIDDLSTFYAKRNLTDLASAKQKLVRKKKASLANKKMAQDMGCSEA